MIKKHAESEEKLSELPTACTERNVAVISVSSPRAENFSLSITPRSERDSQNAGDAEILSSVHSRVWENAVFYSGKAEEKYFGALLSLRTDGTVEALCDALAVKNARFSEIFIKIFTGEAPLELEASLQELRAMPSYTLLYREQKKQFAARYGNTELCLYDGRNHANEELLYQCRKGKVTGELFEKLYRFGRYLFVCGTAKDSLPFAQYGLWSGDYNAQWSQNVLNENLEMIYSHVFTGNLLEPLQAVFNYFDEMLPQYRDMAKKVFGCRGIVIHAYSCPHMGGVLVNFPVITNWTGAGAWIADFYYRYYKMTHDRDFLVQRALPFLREVCLFYSDFLYKTEDGKIEIYPSVSPENSPGNFWKEGTDTLTHPMPAAANATMDVALIRQVIAQYLQLREENYETEDEFCAKLREISADLPEYLVERDALKEWCSYEFKENQNHRHFSHLYPMWPGDEIRQSHPLYPACAEAVRLRTENGLQHQSAWSLAHLANIYCRLHQGEKAQACLEYIVQSSVLNNFFTVHNDWRGMGLNLDTKDIAPVQLDVNMGIVSAMQEMLLHHDGKTLEILPALPALFRKGIAKNLRTPEGFVTIEWNADAGEIVLTTDIPGVSENTVALPEGFKKIRVVRCAEERT